MGEVENSMSFDFIKWLTSKTKDFNVRYETYEPPAQANSGWYCNTPHDSFKIGQDSPLWKKVYYPLLLQTAIEGINADGSEWIINMDWTEIKFTTYPTRSEWQAFLYRAYDSIDLAKEAALKYIYKQETKG